MVTISVRTMVVMLDADEDSYDPVELGHALHLVWKMY